MRCLPVLAVATLAATAVATVPNRAEAAEPTVTSPACGSLSIAAGSSPQTLLFDTGTRVQVEAGRTASLHGLPAGDYRYKSSTGANFGPTTRLVTVRACTTTSPRRPVPGDQDGDGRADLLAVTAQGDLYHYRSTGSALSAGTRIGGGWGSTVFIRQVTEVEGAGSGNALLAVRRDGTVWLYPSLGRGRYGTARQVGSGANAYSDFAVSQPTSWLRFGRHCLLARQGDTINVIDLRAAGTAVTRPAGWFGGWRNTPHTIGLGNFTGDNNGDTITITGDGRMWLRSTTASSTGVGPLFDPPRQIGVGWSAMALVTSPGSLDGDRLDDLVARRSDGNLYFYRNAGGHWAAAQQIGSRWNNIRLLG